MSLATRARAGATALITRATAATLAARWRRRASAHRGRPHGLAEKLVVSLTSYPPRYGTLLPTLKSLLLQTVRPDAVELWIAHGDLEALPPAVTALRADGLAIRTCDDLRSYKKLVPALAAHPGAVIVTADDDAYYWPRWLEELVSAYRPGGRQVVCHRAHQVLFEAGRPLGYADWTFEIGDRTSQTIFPTGLGGILYPPGIFAGDVLRQDLFQRYCPTADDVWFFWMASLNGASFRKVGPRRRFVLWPDGQGVALYNHNVVGQNANDRQIDAMTQAYGPPPAWKSA